MRTVQTFCHCIVWLINITLYWPLRRCAAIMLHLFKIALAKTEQCSAIHFAVAAYIIMNKRFKWLIIFIEPFIVRAIAANSYYFMCIPVLFFFRNKSAAFQNQNPLAAWCKFICHRTAAATGTDDDNVVMITHNFFTFS